MMVQISGILSEVYVHFITEFPNICQSTPREKALAVASYLRKSNLTGIEAGREYHCLEHNFLGTALDDPSHNSLPLVSAAIYCYVAQRLGVNACPCGFPLHVHVIVMPPPGYDLDGNGLDAAEQGEPMYLDPFRSEQETHLSTLQNQLALLGASHIEQGNFLGESQITETVLRCARNILTSIQRMPQFPITHPAPVDFVSARYAALWSSMLFLNSTQAAELHHYLPWLMELFATDFPSDVSLVDQYLAPLFRDMPEYEHILESLHVMRAVDEMPKQARRRVTDNSKVKYWIGQVFEHRRYNYKAIITGWDTECGAEEHWMRRMGIDRLQAGRYQSFYHVLYVAYLSLRLFLVPALLTQFSVEDKSIRYVAEENIEPIFSHLGGLPQKLIAIAGRHFKRWDPQTQSFVSNMKDEYPDD